MAAFLLATQLPGSTGYAEGEGGLIQNGGFESVGAGQPSSWTVDSWHAGEAYSRLTIQQEVVHSGSNAALIENLQPNDAKYIQKVSVDSDSVYKLSAYVLVDHADADTKGANISILGIGDTSVDLKSTNGAWELLEFYGKTGKSQKELQVAVRLGGYGSLGAGKAYFDDVSLTKLSAAPAGATVFDLAPKGSDIPDAVSAMGIAAAAVVFGLLYFFVYQRWIRPQPTGSLRERRHFGLLFGAAVVTALIIRFLVAMKSPGYVVDVNTFKAWANKVATNGLAHFYDGQFADYPPGYMYILWIVGSLQQVFHLDWASKGALLLIKLPALLADAAIAYLLYREGKKRISPSTGFGLALLFLFNPAVLVNSAGWGQMDSFFTLILLGALLLLASGKWEGSAAIFAFAILVKPQALIFTPVFLFEAFRKRQWGRLAGCVAVGLGVFLVLIAPFSFNQSSPFWIIDLYKSTLGQYAYATLNAFNIYALFGANMVSADLGSPLSYTVVGYSGIVLTVAAAAYFFFRRKTEGEDKLFFIPFLLLFMVFMLSVKMHERYLFPAIALALFAFLFSKDRRLLHLSVGLSVVQYFNVHYVLKSAAINQPHLMKHDGIMLAMSFVSVILLLWLLKIGYDLYVKGRKVLVEPYPEYKSLPPEGTQVALLHPVDSNAKMSRFTRRDWLFMGAITLAYSIVAFVNLGSTHSPVTTWEPSYGASATVDLGEVKQIDRVNTFGEIGTGKFRLEFAEEPGAFGNAVTVENTYTKVFWWNVQEVSVKARYVKVSVEESGFALNEMAFYQKDNPTPLTIASVQDDDGKTPVRGKAAYLFDEQEDTFYQPTFMNQTYFDEIYHARTAYEHLHMMKPYENTHPPLGKLIMSVGIWLFGMNPFGWRIAGTLVGILMVPLTYVFARRLFGKPGYAALAALLMAVEFMHFAQTRIATIDSYGVFFIMLMYYFMYRYYSMSFYKAPLKKTLVPLFLSGLFFGIGAASKWIVIYGGAGLALLFFLSLFERYREWRTAGKLLQLSETEGKSELREELLKIRKVFGRYTVKTVAWCTLFFVVVPVLIYSLSFLPIMSVPGEEKSVHQLVQYQENMYNYHSKLKATHGFGSPWYEWPLMVRPIWYYSGKPAVAADQVSSIWSFGNPAVWWVGLAAFLAMLFYLKKDKHRGMFVVTVAFFSQFLPWVLVTRLTFIYHYFAMVPFLIFSIVYIAKKLLEKKPEWKPYVIGYAVLAVVLFAMFYPVLSGMTVSKWYVDHFLRWFGTWYFYTG
ncbi:glycosyltransferase family 39 protein [Gorillibacterium sp. CAU 1737]